MIDVKVDDSDVKKKLGHIEDALKDPLEGVAEALRPGMERVRTQAVSIYQSVTPVVTGTLQRSTAATVSVAKTGANITITQPATNTQGQQYVQWVLPPGHGSYPGNPYNRVANARIAPILNSELRTAGKALLTSITHKMKIG